MEIVLPEVDAVIIHFACDQLVGVHPRYPARGPDVPSDMTPEGEVYHAFLDSIRASVRTLRRVRATCKSLASQAYLQKATSTELVETLREALVALSGGSVFAIVLSGALSHTERRSERYAEAYLRLYLTAYYPRPPHIKFEDSWRFDPLDRQIMSDTTVTDPMEDPRLLFLKSILTDPRPDFRLAEPSGSYVTVATTHLYAPKEFPYPDSFVCAYIDAMRNGFDTLIENLNILNNA